MSVKGGTAGAVTVRLGGAGPQIEPTRAHCRERWSDHSEFILEAPVKFAVSEMFLGRPAWISFVCPDGRRRQRMAVVNEVEVLMQQGEDTRVRLMLNDPLNDLHHSHNTRLFLDASPVAVVDKLLADYRLLVRRLRPETEAPVLPQYLQVKESDHDCLQRLLATHDLRYDYRDEHDDAWYIALQSARSAWLPAPRPSYEVLEAGAPLAMENGGLRTVFTACGECRHRPERSDQGRAQDKAEKDDEVPDITLALSGTVADIGPGRRFQLNGALPSHLKRRAWVARQVDTRWDRSKDEFISEIRAWPAEADLPLVAPKPRKIPLFFQAEVESTGRYAEPDEQGRYRIRYGFDQEARARTGASPPISILSPYAGPLTEHGATGWHFPLLPGGRLLMSCLNGDPDQPVVVGYLSRKGQAGPVNHENAQEHVIETSSGHGLSMNDDPKAERIVFQALDGRIMATLGQEDARGKDKRQLLALANKVGAFDVQAGRRINITVEGNAHTRASGNQETQVQSGIKTEAGTIHEQSGMQWMAVSQKAMNLEGRQMQVKGENIKVGAKKLTVRSEKIAGRSGRHIIVQAEGKLHIRSEEGPIWLGTEKAGFLLEPNKITIKARNLKLNARKGIVRKGKHDRRNETTDVQAPEGPQLREVADIPRVPVDGKAHVKHLSWSRPELLLGEPIDLRFTVAHLEDEDQLEVEVGHRLDKSRFEVLDTCPVECDTQNGRIEMQWDSERIRGEAQRLTRDARPDCEGLFFRVRLNNTVSEASPALKVLVRLKLNFLPPEGVGTLSLRRLQVVQGDHILPLKRIDQAWHVEAGIPGHIGVHAYDPQGRAMEFSQVGEQPLTAGLERGTGVECPGPDSELDFHCLPPAVQINLRDDDVRLSDDELAYYQNLGNATLFIHGYNVPHGDPPKWLHRFDTPRRERGNRRQSGPMPQWAADLPPASVYRDIEAINQVHGVRIRKPISAPELDPEKALNGRGAEEWFRCAEYQLNRAAHDGEIDWSQYTRTINISWPGDTGGMNFVHAVVEANRSGRRLVPVLKQLLDAGVKVNIIAHSLGCRVTLAALNLLGADHGAGQLENVFLWQAAVADTALEPKHHMAGLLGLDSFPNAHRAARHLIVLHSSGDQVLGPSDKEAGHGAGDNLRRGEVAEALYGMFGGAYSRKGVGLVPLVDEYYGDVLGPYARRRDVFENNDRRSVADRERDEEVILAREQNFVDHLNKLQDRLLKKARDSSVKPEEDPLLRPLAHNPEITPALISEWTQRLYWLWRGDYHGEHESRALGYYGPPIEEDYVIGWRETEKLEIVDQTKWLNSHSDMRIPSDELFREVYRKEIMERRILARTGFGRSK